jgi:hypothetical protein
MLTKNEIEGVADELSKLDPERKTGTLIVLSEDTARDQAFLADFHDSGWHIVFARKTAMQ